MTELSEEQFAAISQQFIDEHINEGFVLSDYARGIARRAFELGKEAGQCDTEQAMDFLRSAIRKDESYAWSWHCNIAMCLYDELMSENRCSHEYAHAVSNNAASRFMLSCFDVRTEQPKPGSE